MNGIYMYSLSNFDPLRNCARRRERFQLQRFQLYNDEENSAKLPSSVSSFMLLNKLSGDFVSLSSRSHSQKKMAKQRQTERDR
ncbi:hypothetical protein M0802_004393 [Mischocyttarus mexicanus]|nr:hypothetical protein M0802_004393 [Mischocyttarus mexicanus]